MKQKFPLAEAELIAQEFVSFFARYCERVEVAGSLRRRKQWVGDLEILFVPRWEQSPDPDDLFGAPREVNISEQAIETLLRTGILKRRPNINGVEAWGTKNKLAVHADSGLPVDLFTASERNWFNYLVCRTGGAENNVRICEAAISKGWKWNPYGAGFTRQASQHFASNGETLEARQAPLAHMSEEHVVQSEPEVFEFAGLDYREPWERD